MQNKSQLIFIGFNERNQIGLKIALLWTTRMKYCGVALNLTTLISAQVQFDYQIHCNDR